MLEIFNPTVVPSPRNRPARFLCMSVAEADVLDEYEHCGVKHWQGVSCGGDGRCNFHKGHATDHHCPTCDQLF